MLDASEEILWEGKPQKKAFFIERILGRNLIPFVLLVEVFVRFFVVLPLVFGVIGGVIDSEIDASIMMASFPWYYAVILAVIWLALMISIPIIWANEYYIATAERIIIRCGFVGKRYTIAFNADMRSVSVRVSGLDKAFKVGDVLFDSGMTAWRRNRGYVPIYYLFRDIEGAAELSQRMQGER
jgi:hypothetical protein